jgi:hypothetical protein
MSKPLIKIIKRDDNKAKKAPVSKRPAKPKKQRTVENTVQGWISERRENDDAENRSRKVEWASWKADLVPAKTV